MISSLAAVQQVKDKKFLKALGLHLKKLREQKGLSQLDLGVKMDNYAEQISRIERGQINVTICTLKNIADSLEMSLRDLLDFQY